MLRIEQMEGNLFLIELNIKETVKFHGVFETREDIDESTLVPMKNGLKMEIELDD